MASAIASLTFLTSRARAGRLNVGAEVRGPEFHAAWQGCGGIASDSVILGTPAERREAFQGTRRSDQAARAPLDWCMLLKPLRARRQKRKACGPCNGPRRAGDSVAQGLLQGADAPAATGYWVPVTRIR
jgi:hypothetical protein